MKRNVGLEKVLFQIYVSSTLGCGKCQMILIGSECKQSGVADNGMKIEF